MAPLKIWQFRLSCSIRTKAGVGGVGGGANRRQSLPRPPHTWGPCGLQAFCLDPPHCHNAMKQDAICVFKVSQLFVRGDG